MKNNWIVIVAVLFVSSITTEARYYSSIIQVVRTIFTKRGVSLITQLLPGDQVVIVKRGDIPPTEDGFHLGPLPDMKVEIEALKQRGNAVVVAEVLRTESMLVDGDSWINTRVTILSERTIVEGRSPIFNADNVAAFDQDGGEVTIKGVTVRVISNNYLFQPREKYLLTLQRMHDGSVALASVPFRIDDSGVVTPIRLTNGSVIEHPSNFYGMSIDAVIAHLRRDQ